MTCAKRVLITSDHNLHRHELCMGVRSLSCFSREIQMGFSKLLKRLLVHCCVVYSTSGLSEHFKEGGACFFQTSAGNPLFIFPLPLPAHLALPTYCADWAFYCE